MCLEIRQIVIHQNELLHIKKDHLNDKTNAPDIKAGKLEFHTNYLGS